MLELRAIQQIRSSEHAQHQILDSVRVDYTPSEYMQKMQR